MKAEKTKVVATRDHSSSMRHQTTITSKSPRHKRRSLSCWRPGLSTYFKRMALPSSENGNDQHITDAIKT